MAARPNGDTLRWLDTIHREGSFARMTDGQLLGRFLERPDAASQVAFEALVRRHGPMVLSLCRGVLRDEHDADDAFQATFLVLARRASNIRDRDRLATWLGRVARRIALRSRAEASRRAALERRLSARRFERRPRPGRHLRTRDRVVGPRGGRSTPRGRSPLAPTDVLAGEDLRGGGRPAFLADRDGPQPTVSRPGATPTEPDPPRVGPHPGHRGPAGSSP